MGRENNKFQFIKFLPELGKDDMRKVHRFAKLLSLVVCMITSVLGHASIVKACKNVGLSSDEANMATTLGHVS